MVYLVERLLALTDSRWFNAVLAVIVSQRGAFTDLSRSIRRVWGFRRVCVTFPRDIRATQVAAFTTGSECSPPGCGARVTVSGAPVHDAGDPGHAVPRYLPNAVPSSTIRGNTIR